MYVCMMEVEVTSNHVEWHLFYICSVNNHTPNTNIKRIKLQCIHTILTSCFTFTVYKLSLMQLSQEFSVYVNKIDKKFNNKTLTMKKTMCIFIHTLIQKHVFNKGRKKRWSKWSFCIFVSCCDPYEILIMLLIKHSYIVRSNF